MPLIHPSENFIGIIILMHKLLELEETTSGFVCPKTTQIIKWHRKSPNENWVPQFGVFPEKQVIKYHLSKYLTEGNQNPGPKTIQLCENPKTVYPTKI